MLELLKKWCSSLYYLYELNTCIYMFEPWEKRFINSLVVIVLALLIFSSYVYLPKYTENLVGLLTPGVVIAHEAPVQESFSLN